MNTKLDLKFKKLVDQAMRDGSTASIQRLLACVGENDEDGKKIDAAKQCLDHLYQNHLHTSPKKDLAQAIGLTARLLEIVMEHEYHKEHAQCFDHIALNPKNYSSYAMSFMWTQMMGSVIENKNVSAQWFEPVFKKMQPDEHKIKVLMESLTKRAHTEKSSKCFDLLKLLIQLSEPYSIQKTMKGMIFEAMEKRDHQKMEVWSCVMDEAFLYDTIKEYEEDWAQKTPTLQVVLDKVEMERAVFMRETLKSKRKI